MYNLWYFFTFKLTVKLNLLNIKYLPLTLSDGRGDVAVLTKLIWPSTAAPRPITWKAADIGTKGYCWHVGEQLVAISLEPAKWYKMVIKSNSLYRKHHKLVLCKKNWRRNPDLDTVLKPTTWNTPRLGSNIISSWHSMKDRVLLTADPGLQAIYSLPDRACERQSSNCWCWSPSHMLSTWQSMWKTEF